jgi:hypothetical protein
MVFMESLEEKLMKNASNSESDAGNKEEKEQTEQLKKREQELGDALKKLNHICYSIGSYHDLDENLIGRYSLDAIKEKCHFLAEMIKSDSTTFIEKSQDLQHYIGNFEGGLNMLPHLEQSTKKESLLGKSFQKKTSEFENFLDSQIQSGHGKKTTIH